MTTLIGAATKVAAGCLAAALVAGGVVATTGDSDAVLADADLGLDVAVAIDSDIGVSDGGSQDDATDRSDGTTNGSDGTTDGTTTDCVADVDGSAADGTQDSDGTTSGTAGSDTAGTDSSGEDGSESMDAGVLSIDAVADLTMALDAEGLVLTGLDADVGVTAKMVAETRHAIIIDFVADGDTTTVVIVNIDGMITAMVDGELTALVAADASAGADGTVDEIGLSGAIDAGDTIGDFGLEVGAGVDATFDDGLAAGADAGLGADLGGTVNGWLTAVLGVEVGG